VRNRLARASGKGAGILERDNGRFGDSTIGTLSFRSR
jgi:hypothetical protein